MNVGDLVTFSSTGSKLVVVRETRKKIYKHLSQQGVENLTAFAESSDYTFHGIILSTEGVSNTTLEGIKENYAAFALRRSMARGARMLVLWSNVPYENSSPRGFDVRKGRDNYYASCQYSLWKRSDLKKIKFNKKKK